MLKPSITFHMSVCHVIIVMEDFKCKQSFFYYWISCLEASGQKKTNCNVRRHGKCWEEIRFLDKLEAYKKGIVIRIDIPSIRDPWIIIRIQQRASFDFCHLAFSQIKKNWGPYPYLIKDNRLHHSTKACGQVYRTFVLPLQLEVIILHTVLTRTK